jgi:hypothetical protein
MYNLCAHLSADCMPVIMRMKFCLRDNQVYKRYFLIIIYLVFIIVVACCKCFLHCVCCCCCWLLVSGDARGWGTADTSEHLPWTQGGGFGTSLRQHPHGTGISFCNTWQTEHCYIWTLVFHLTHHIQFSFLSVKWIQLYWSIVFYKVQTYKYSLTS